MREAQLKDAKASFSAVVDQAVNGEPTVVTRHGKPVAVILGYDQWMSLQGTRPPFSDLLLSFPGMDEVSRDAAPRDLGL